MRFLERAAAAPPADRTHGRQWAPSPVTPHGGQDHHGVQRQGRATHRAAEPRRYRAVEPSDRRLPRAGHVAEDGHVNARTGRTARLGERRPSTAPFIFRLNAARTLPIYGVDFPPKGAPPCPRPFDSPTPRPTGSWTCHYQGDRETAIQRLTAASLYVFNSPRRDRVELDADLSGEPISSRISDLAVVLLPIRFVVTP